MRSQAAAARARCLSCGGGLSFAAWSRGEELCPVCEQVEAAPAATYVPMHAPPRAMRRPSAPVPETQAALDAAADLPDELLDELVAALEAEARRAPQGAVQTALHDVLDEVGFGRDPREMSWALWGFAGGFGLNLAVAKYAQMASETPMSEFIPAFAFGGLVAGMACGAIGWALAKLRA